MDCILSRRHSNANECPLCFVVYSRPSSVLDISFTAVTEVFLGSERNIHHKRERQVKAAKHKGQKDEKPLLGYNRV